MEDGERDRGGTMRGIERGEELKLKIKMIKYGDWGNEVCRGRRVNDW